jgi:branched-chain amino acid transport system substrate-binding protein
VGKKRLLAAVLSICLVLSLLSLAFATACPSPTAPEQKTLKIGALLSMTGWYSIIDTLEADEAQAVAKMINDKDGITIDGQKYLIELVIEDGKSDFDGVASAASKLAFDDGVQFVVGPSGFWSAASSGTFEQNKILHVSSYVTGSPGELDASTLYGFVGHNCAIADAVAAEKALKTEFPDVEKVVICLPDDGNLSITMPKHERLIGLQGLTIVGDIVAYPNEMEDFSPIVAKLNSIKDADAYLLLNGAPPHLGNILKGLRELGNDKPCATSSLSSCFAISVISGNAAATKFIAPAITPHAPGNTPLLDEVCDMLGNQYEEQGVIYMMSGNALWVLTRAIEAAQSLDPTEVKEKWESMDTIETLFGTGTLCGEEIYGLQNHAIAHPLPYQKLMDGQVLPGGWVNVDPLP